MTEEERIAFWGDLVPTITSTLGDLALEGDFVMIDFARNIMSHAEKKVMEEREVCADIAENWRCNGMPRYGVAEAIRARGQE